MNKKLLSRFLASLVVGTAIGFSSNDVLVLMGRCLCAGVILGVFFVVYDAPTRKDLE